MILRASFVLPRFKLLNTNESAATYSKRSVFK